jgi:hypothetical protein
MRRALTVVSGVVLGGFAGLILAFALLLALDAAGISDFVNKAGDVPLDGWIAEVATLYGCVLTGCTIGAVVAWRRSRRA